MLVNPDTCIGCKLCSWACPYGAREYDETDGVMKKCTLCIDKIYNENLDEIDRVPACVATCPAGARSFGDLGDPNSDVSRLVEDRGGYDLMPELDYRPVNKYLPPREPQINVLDDGQPLSLVSMADNANQTEPSNNYILKWVDTILSR